MIHFFYGMVFFGFLTQIPRYVYFWNIFVQVSLCLFLMYNYNPFRTEYKISIYDAKMIFGAASILLINIISLPYLLSIVEMSTSLDLDFAKGIKIFSKRGEFLFQQK